MESFFVFFDLWSPCVQEETALAPPPMMGKPPEESTEAHDAISPGESYLVFKGLFKGCLSFLLMLVFEGIPIYLFIKCFFVQSDSSYMMRKSHISFLNVLFLK